MLPTDPDHELAGVRHEQAFHTRDFVGREALLDSIDAWIAAHARGAGLLLSGPPGAGKSALAAAIARRHEGHALLHMVKSHRSPRRFLPSLVSQAARLSGASFGASAYLGDIDDLRDALTRALDAVIARLGLAVLVIDAVDELDPDLAYGGPLSFLPAALPEGARVILTARPDLPLLAAVRARIADLDELAVPPLTRGDVDALAARRLAGLAARVDLGALFDRTGGSPLLVTRALSVLARELEAGESARLDRLPASAADVFADVYREIAAGGEDGKLRARLLQILSVAREPLGVADLADLAGIPHERCLERVTEASRFLVDTGGRFHPFHRGLAEHVRERVLGAEGVRDIEASLAASAARTRSGYALRHRVAHLLALGRAAEAADLLLDGPSLDARAEAGLVFDLVAEMGDVAKALPAEAPQRPILEALAAAIRVHAHFVARHPEALFQTVDAAKSPALADLLARWRAHKPGHVWLRAVASSPAPSSLISVLRRHHREVLSVAVSPSGDRLASASEDGTLRLWDVRTGAVLHTLRASDRRALSVAFSPDGRRVACGTDEGRARLWEVSDGAEITSLGDHDGPVWAVAFSPDGQALASGGRDGTLRVRRPDGRDLWSKRLDGVVTSLAFSPDGGRLAAAMTGPRVALFAASDGADLGAFVDLEDTPWSLAFSPDGGPGAPLAVAAADGVVRLLGAGLELLAELRLPDERLWACAFSPDGSRVACGGTGRRIHVWTPGVGGAPVSIPAHGGAVDALAFTPDGEVVVSGSADGAVRLHRALAAEEARSASAVTAAVFSHRGHRLAVGYHDGRVELRDASTNACDRRLAPHTRHVVALAFSPDDRLLASASRDGTVAVHRADGRPLARLVGHEGPVTAVAFTPDGARVITGSSDRTVRLYSLFGARQTHRFEHGEAVTALDLSRDGERLVAGARGGEVRVFDLRTREQIASYMAPASLPGRAGEADPRQRDVVRVHAGDDEVTAVTRAGVCFPGPGSEEPPSVGHPDETEIRRPEGALWYPSPLSHLVASPTGRAWAAWEGGELILLGLERA